MPITAKSLGSLAAILALGVIAAVPAVAQASPSGFEGASHWSIEGESLAPGKENAVSFTITGHKGFAILGSTLNCDVTGEGYAWNDPEDPAERNTSAYAEITSYQLDVESCESGGVMSGCYATSQGSTANPGLETTWPVYAGVNEGETVVEYDNVGLAAFANSECAQGSGFFGGSSSSMQGSWLESRCVEAHNPSNFWEETSGGGREVEISGEDCFEGIYLAKGV